MLAIPAEDMIVIEIPFPRCSNSSEFFMISKSFVAAVLVACVSVPGYAQSVGAAENSSASAAAKSPAAIPVAPKPPAEQPEEGRPESATHAPDEEPIAASKVRRQEVAPPEKGERIIFLGNGLAERDVYYSRLETEFHLRYPEGELFVRNMGRSGDTPAFRPHAARVSQWAFPGAEKFRPEFVQHHGIGFFPRHHGDGVGRRRAAGRNAAAGADR